MTLHGKGYPQGPVLVEPRRIEVDVLDRDEAEERSVPKLGAYLADSRRYYTTPRGRRPLTASEASASLTEMVRNGPALVRLVRGREALYTWHGTRYKNERRLVLREVDPVPEEYGPAAYDDPYIETIASVPRSRRQVAHLYECATCGRLGVVRGRRPAEASDAIARSRDWHETVARGWVCPRHYHGPRRSRPELPLDTPPLSVVQSAIEGVDT